MIGLVKESVKDNLMMKVLYITNFDLFLFIMSNVCQGKNSCMTVKLIGLMYLASETCVLLQFNTLKFYYNGQNFQIIPNTRLYKTINKNI